MFCTACGSQMTAGASHCTSCGSAVAAPPASSSWNGGQTEVSEASPVTNQPQQVYSGGAQFNQGYSQQAYVSTTSGKAVASLVLSLLGISLLGVIFGHIARGDIKRSGGRINGDGLAIAGLVLGWIGMAAWALIWIGIIAIISDPYFFF